MSYNRQSGGRNQRNDAHDRQDGERDHRAGDRGYGQRRENENGGRGEIQCRRCGGYGHIQIGCRVRLDHLRKPLN